VTELVSDFDLVHRAALVGRGPSALGRGARRRRRGGGSGAARLRAAHQRGGPARAFAPTPGLITGWREPSGPGVRMDSGFEEGWRVSGDYDSLLAKLLVVAPDRAGAIARAMRALDEFETGVVQTTIPFHRWLLDPSRFPEVATAYGRTSSIAPGIRRPRGMPLARRAGGAWWLGPRRCTDPPVATPLGSPPDGATPAGATPGGLTSARPGGEGSAGWVRPKGPDWTHAGRREATERWWMRPDEPRAPDRVRWPTSSWWTSFPWTWSRRRTGSPRFVSRRPQPAIRRWPSPIRGHRRRVGVQRRRGVRVTCRPPRASDPGRSRDGTRRPRRHQGADPGPRRAPVGLPPARRSRRANGCWPSRR